MHALYLKEQYSYNLSSIYDDEIILEHDDLLASSPNTVISWPLEILLVK